MASQLNHDAQVMRRPSMSQYVEAGNSSIVISNDLPKLLKCSAMGKKATGMECLKRILRKLKKFSLYIFVLAAMWMVD